MAENNILTDAQRDAFLLAVRLEDAGWTAQALLFNLLRSNCDNTELENCLEDNLSTFICEFVGDARSAENPQQELTDQKLVDALAAYGVTYVRS